MKPEPNQTLDLPGLNETLEMPPGIIPRERSRQLHMVVGFAIFVAAALLVYGAVAKKKVPRTYPLPVMVMVEIPEPVEPVESTEPVANANRELMTFKAYLDQEEAGMDFTFFKKRFSMKKDLDFIRKWAGEVKTVR